MPAFEQDQGLVRIDGFDDPASCVLGQDVPGKHSHQWVALDDEDDPRPVLSGVHVLRPFALCTQSRVLGRSGLRGVKPKPAGGIRRLETPHTLEPRRVRDKDIVISIVSPPGLRRLVAMKVAKNPGPPVNDHKETYPTPRNMHPNGKVRSQASIKKGSMIDREQMI